MLGQRPTQRELFLPENRLRKKIGEESFYVFLADHRDELFADRDFAMLYCLANGRPSVPPSLLATALLLQIFDNVSDQEAADRARFDQRWQLALGISEEAEPFAKSTLCLFRNQLNIHEEARLLLEKSIAYLQRLGMVKHHKMKIVLDTTPIFGKGAVLDTFNLLAEGLRMLLKALAEEAKEPVEDYAWQSDFIRYIFEPSFKGSFEHIDWDDATARQRVLQTLVSDCRRALELAAQVLERYPAESKEAAAIVTASDLLAKLLAQDVRETKAGRAELIRGVAKDRIVSVHDTEVRHGRKSKSQAFNGYKAAIAVEPESTAITAVDVMPANTHDSQDMQTLIKESERTTGATIATVIGDTAYGTLEARLEAAEAERPYTLVAPSPKAPATGRFAKDAFQIDLERSEVRCPAGKVTRVSNRNRHTTPSGRVLRFRIFSFAERQCADCPLRDQCIKKKTRFRTVRVNEAEDLLRAAKAFQQTDAFDELHAFRVVVEHKIGRLIALGMRRARYFGSKKTLFQLALTAAVANLTLAAAFTSSTLCMISLAMLCLFQGIVSRSRTSYETRSPRSALIA